MQVSVTHMKQLVAEMPKRASFFCWVSLKGNPFQKEKVKKGATGQLGVVQTASSQVEKQFGCGHQGRQDLQHIRVCIFECSSSTMQHSNIESFCEGHARLSHVRDCATAEMRQTH